MEIQKGRISVIIPVYNVEAYLRYCVESVRSQTYPDLEILLVDDGSPDKSGSLCDAFAREDKRIRVLHQENGGQCAARNAGLDIASGEYVMFVDSDDIVRSTICEKLYALAVQHEAQLVRCSYFSFTDYATIPQGFADDTEKETCYDSQGALENFVCAPFSGRKHFIPSVCTTLFKKELFDTVRFPNGLIYEEGFVLPKIYMQCRKLVYLDARLYGYFRHPNSTMTSGFSDKGLKSLDDWKEIHELTAPVYPSLRVPTAERWINKYISLTESIRKTDGVDADGYYMNRIYSTLTEQMPYFETFLPKKTLRKLRAFLNGEEAYAAYCKREAQKEAVRGKFAALLHR